MGRRLGTPISGNLVNCTGVQSSAITGTIPSSQITGPFGSVLIAAPSDPATTTSVAGLMMGVGSTCTLTPLYSTRIFVDFRGNYFNSANTNSLFLILKYGTGTAPANGVASTGTTVGGTLFANITAINVSIPFGGFGGIITGLTPTTAYWFDLVLGVFGAGTVGLQNLTFNAFELR